MENLKNALSKILGTIEQIGKAYEDKKVNIREWFQIGTSALGWVWIFKNLQKIKADIDNATEDGMNAMLEDLKNEFDIPQDAIEETIEQALSVIMLVLTMVGRKVPEFKIK